MQILDAGISAHLAQEVTTLAGCWSITRRDGVAQYFTDHDADVVVDGNSYRSTSGVSPSAVTSMAGLSVDNLELDGFVNSLVVDEQEVLSGKYDHAEVSMFLVNYQNPADGKLKLKTGWLGEVTLRGGQFVAEVRGLSSRLQQVVGEVYTPTCRAKLSDARCRVNLASYTFTATVTAVEAAHAFSASSLTQANDYFAYGLVTFTNGLNNGYSMEVRDFSQGRFGLFLPLPYSIAIGDQFRAVAGCDKQFDTCIGKFHNALNFRGEPHVPGSDKILETSATRSK
ncbi:MAG: DUF2163 domain-containing protein [Rickettsiales bacterium]